MEAARRRRPEGEGEGGDGGGGGARDSEVCSRRGAGEPAGDQVRLLLPSALARSLSGFRSVAIRPPIGCGLGRLERR